MADGLLRAGVPVFRSVDRALRVGSVDRIIKARDVRPYVIDALERGMARYAG